VSEYQCYEFVALDRPLIAKEMAELRGISTRAEITPTRFWNEYHWGDLKADPAKLLARYFDLHLYFANWGTRRLMLRLPIAAVDNRALGAYLPGDPATLTTVGEHAIVDLCSEVDEPEDDWFEARGLAGSLTPLRAELLRGDLRVAYLAWLLAVQAGRGRPACGGAAGAERSWRVVGAAGRAGRVPARRQGPAGGRRPGERAGGWDRGGSLPGVG
jgi:hypothetical protein